MGTIGQVCERGQTYLGLFSRTDGSDLGRSFASFVKQSIQRVAQWGNVTTWFDQLARRNCGLHHYAAFLANQGKYDDAEPLYKRALTIKEEVLGPRHPDVASRLNNLASLLKSQVMWHRSRCFDSPFSILYVCMVIT